MRLKLIIAQKPWIIYFILALVALVGILAFKFLL